jgi:uncharacterized membrane protein YbaN (DUF454 family)
MDSHAASPEPGAPPAIARACVVRWLYGAAGSLFVALGVAGIVLPLLPSTPFFLLAAGCFGKSSPRAYRWLLTNRCFGAQLRAYREHRGATIRSKTIAIATIWVGISLSILVFNLPLMLAALLVVIAASVSFYLLRLRSIPTETPALAAERSSWG